MQLSREEFFLFQNNGYLLIPQAIEPERIVQLKEVIMQQAEDRIPPLVTEDPQRPGHGVAGDVAGARVLRLSRVLERSPVFLKAAAAPRLVAVLQSLLGPNVDVVTNRHNHVTLRPPGAAALEWHRDVTNWSRAILAAIFYLEDATISNGCTRVLPGSHKMLDFHAEMECHGRIGNLGGLQAHVLPVPARAGDVLICNGLLLHGAGANRSDHSRLSMTLGYHAVDELGLDVEPHKMLVCGERTLRHNTPGTGGPTSENFRDPPSPETWPTATSLDRVLDDESLIPLKGRPIGDEAPNLRLDGSLKLYQRALRVIPGGTQTNSKRPQRFAQGGYPIYAKCGTAGYVVDVDGNRYIDLVQALGPVILGYACPAVDQAIKHQLQKGALYGLLSPLEVECAELICEVVPCAEMVRFFKGGGEATAAAARTVRAFTGRELILNVGYRGWPDVWSVLVDDAGIPQGLSGTVLAVKRHDLADLERNLTVNSGRVAAVFLDVDSEPPRNYLADVRRLCRRHGALLVFDEVVTGFRLAIGGAQEHFQVVPDVACFAKALGNGMPLACVAGRADVMSTMADRFITITYGGEALSLAAAIAVIQELRAKDAPSYLWRLGKQLREGLNAAAKRNGVPFSCHGLDPMSRMTLADCSPDGPSSRYADLGWEFILQEMAARGVLLSRGGANFVTCGHDRSDIELVIAAADEVFARLAQLETTPELEHAVRSRKVSVMSAGRSGNVDQAAELRAATESDPQ